MTSARRKDIREKMLKLFLNVRCFVPSIVSVSKETKNIVG
jgi:hypothetical protein